jgi:hypothetical protein
MKVGDLVKYAPFPHEELHKSGMTGLVASEPYADRGLGIDLHLIDIIWGRDRGAAYPAGCICQEYVDELELISETR